jgi:hypothetical protein
MAGGTFREGLLLPQEAPAPSRLPSERGERALGRISVADEASELVVRLGSGPATSSPTRGIY